MIKYLVWIPIVVVIALRLLRSPLGARLLGISERALQVAYVVLVVLTLVIAIGLEEWLLTGIAGALLLVEIIEAVVRHRHRDRSG